MVKDNNKNFWIECQTYHLCHLAQPAPHVLLTLLQLEVHVAMVHDSTGKLVDAHLLFTG